MKLSRSVAIGIGAISTIPYIYGVAFFSLLLPKLEAATGTGRAYDRLFALTFISGVAIVLSTLSILAFYVLYAHRMEHVPPPARRRWARLILLANVGIIPIFWYLHMWRPPRGAA